MRCKIGFVVAICAVLTYGTPALASSYTWTGLQDSGWYNGNNWASNSIAPTGGTFSNRLNVNSSSPSPTVCQYSDAQGYTIYGGSGLRGLTVGSTGLGTFSIIGGTWESRCDAADPDIVGNGSTGSLSIDGGSYVNTAGGGILVVNLQLGTGNLNVNSGTCTVSTIQFGDTSVSTGNGNVALNGGTLSVGTFNDTGVTASTINFNGGVLKPLASSATFMQGLDHVYVQSGGANVDTNGFNVTIGNALLAGTPSGGLVKNSAGTLTLAGADTYTGNTTVNAGTLALANTSSTLMDVNPGTSTQFLGLGVLNLNGAMKLDVADVIGTSGSWGLIAGSLTTSYGGSFAVYMADGTPFSNSGGVWTDVDSASRRWTFTQATGILSVTVPEPGALLLLVTGLLGLLAYAWRKRR